jgi:NAD(P)-dependent dehydrogenase (short-subunit alcohol dehydrogenase family)
MSERYPELDGKTVLVTGGSRGIGAACVRDLVREGANVAFNYRAATESAERLVAELGADRALAVQADLADPVAVERFWDEALAFKGQLDVVVNNASVRTPIDIVDASMQAWDEHWIEALRVNLVATAHLSRFGIKHFRERGSGGVIIGVTGRIAVRGDMPDYLHDGAAKGGMNSLMRGIARFYAADEILTYLICGGIIDTDQARDQIKTHGGDERFLSEIPICEYGRPEDISELVLFLSTRRARYSTGSTIDAVGASYLH